MCDEKQGESVRKPTEPCYFTVMGEKSRGRIVNYYERHIGDYLKTRRTCRYLK